jgi:hypothetical protein
LPSEKILEQGRNRSWQLVSHHLFVDMLVWLN